MRRFIPWNCGADRGIEMRERDAGKYVLHSDHAAELARVEGELEVYRLRLAGALIASEGGNGQPDDAIDAIKTCPTISSVMKLQAANALLRAECEAWRKWSHNRFDGRTMYHGDQFQQIRDTCAATDEAGILKGGAS